MGYGVRRRQGQEVAGLLHSFIEPLEQWLDRQIDRRLARAFFLALIATVRLRHSRSGLLLNELGAHVLTRDQVPAGTRRPSNLLRYSRRPHTLPEQFLWRRADQQLAQPQERREAAPAFGTKARRRSRKASPRRVCARSAPARRHASNASSPAGSGPPAWRLGMQGLPPWPPCVGGPAGAIWPVAAGKRPHPCCPDVPHRGRGG